MSVNMYVADQIGNWSCTILGATSQSMVEGSAMRYWRHEAEATAWKGTGWVDMMGCEAATIGSLIRPD
jgi:hypothetical protein